MTKPSPTSGSFTINRHFNHAPQKVFAAFTTLEIKSKWFIGPKGGEDLERVMNVNTDGVEVLRFKHPSGMVTHFVARYHRV